MPTETEVYLVQTSQNGGFKVYRCSDRFILLETTEKPVFGNESDNLSVYITEATNIDEAKDELGKIGLNVVVPTFA